MTAVRILVLLVGIVILLGTANSVLTVLIVPRPAASLLVYPMIVVRTTFRKVAQLIPTYVAKDRVLAMSEPVALVALLVTWLTMSMFGFTLVNWGIGTGSFATAFSEAGSSVFTLGFTLTHTEGSRVVDFVAAGTGLVLVALQIAYLPALYSAYNRRETLVTLLESGPARRPGGPSCSSAISWSAVSTTCPTCSPSGNGGRPTSPRATRPTRPCSICVRPGRRTRGSSVSWPSWTPPPSTWPWTRRVPPSSLGCASAWGSPA